MKKPCRSHVSILVLWPVVATIGCSGAAPGPDPDGVHLRTGNPLLGPEADVRFRVEAEAFAAGAPVTLTLEHRRGEPVGYNFCTRTLQRRTDEGWVSVGVLRLCTAHLDLLEAGWTAVEDARLPEGLVAGTYRMRLPLYLTERKTQRDVVSSTFRVEG